MVSRLPRLPKAAFFASVVVFVVTSFALAKAANDRFLTEVPAKGGALSEGVIGRPRFINPVLAKSDVDRDMTQLIYSGLMRATPEGILIPDLAESYSESSDGRTYTFVLKEDLYWHDGVRVSAADVVFTIEKIQDKTLEIKSPRRASWEGVAVKALDDRTIEFTLKQPYPPFLENTTIGILPKHIWENIPNAEFDASFYNIEPIGTGPYRVEQVEYEGSKGLPTAYKLVSFKKFALGEPYLTHLTVRFYGNNTELVEAFRQGVVTQIHTVDPVLAETLELGGAVVSRTELPRIFAAFFNPTANPALAMKEVRAALSIATDRNRIVKEVLRGYGKSVTGPLPFEVSTTSLEAVNPESRDAKIAAARKLLADAGWTMNERGDMLVKIDKKKKTETPLKFSIAVSDVDELKRAAMLLQEDWETLGAHVEVRIFEPSTFTTEVITPRAFDVLFFGQVIGRIPDLYPYWNYWHSSQRSAPGLNIAQYASRPVDKLLEELRKTRDQRERTRILRSIDEEIRKDVPAVFVYSPYFLYVRDPRVQGAKTGIITTESERFLDIMNWYVESDRIWQFLIPYTSQSRKT